MSNRRSPSRPGSPMPAYRRWVLPLVALLLAVGACRPAPEETGAEELEVVDVAPRLEVETAEDPQAVARRDEGLSGVLPAHFPGELPLFLPSTLVDFEDEGEGWKSVSLLTAEGLETVSMSLRHELATAGWQVDRSNESRWQLRRGAEQARLRLEDANPGTRYHYEYP